MASGDTGPDRQAVLQASPETDLHRLVALDPEAVYEALGASPGGLTESEALLRAERFGPNRIEELPGPGLLQQLLAQFVHLFALLLWAGSLLAFLARQPFLASAIIAVIMLNGVFGLWQERRAERAVAALKGLLPEAAVVVRQGREQSVQAEALVPGDMVLLSEGDRVSADARVVEAVDLRVDEANLTGESHPVRKTAHAERERGRPPLQSHNLVFAGTSVVRGSGRAVVARTGMTTEFGRIADLTQAQRVEPSPLQREVTRVARRVALLSVIMGATFFSLGYGLAGLPLRDGAIFAVGIVLANVPEGLLPTMTLSLAMGVQRMARRNAVVKRLSSVETLGSCTVICTDKTGTITENEMTVRELWMSGQSFTVTGTGYAPHGDFLLDGRPLGQDELAGLLPLLRIGMLCNAAHLQQPESEEEGWHVRGDPTEGSLLVVAAKAGLDRSGELSARPLVRELAFDAHRKRMSTIHQALREGGGIVAYVKGAPRELLAHCSQILLDDREVDLTDESRDQVAQENDRMARCGLRVLGMAYRFLPGEAHATGREASPGAIERELVFVGLAGMQDPPRPEVPDAVQACHTAGIRIIMITGDYGLTAESIARQVGIVGDAPPTVIAGQDVDGMSDGELAQVLKSQQLIFSRATPEHKVRTVTALQAAGEVVAVTGDGVNDAPALKKADIGVAMGRGGTDVAREAADMVLVDDNFATIVAAVEEGRAIFDNMRKFIVYIFAHLSPEAIPFVFFAVFRTPLPLTVMQILAIDLGTETIPALALGTERAEPDVMRRPPRSRSQRLLDLASLIRGYGFLGLMTTVGVLAAFFLLLTSHGWSWGDSSAPNETVGDQAASAVFVGIVVMQVGNAFACRTERVSAFRLGLLSNRFLLWGIGFELLFVAALVYVPFLQPLFGTAALGWQWWLLPAAFVPGILLAEEARKWAARRREGGGSRNPPVK